VARDDAQLVGRTLDGDKRAFESLVRRHQSRVLAAAIHLVGDRETARDLAQEAFVKAYTSLATLRERQRFGPWMYGILRNLCRRHLERQGPRALSLETDSVPEPVAEELPVEPSELVSAINRLPDGSREILAGRYLHGASYAELAETLGTSAGNVRVRCFRARQALRQLLAASDAAFAAEGGATR